MDVLLDYSPVIIFGEKTSSRMKQFLLFTTIVALLQHCEAPREICVFLESQTKETKVNLNLCGLNEIQHEDMKLLQSVQKLYLQENNLQSIEPHVFSDNKNLTYLYLGGNANLYTPEDECFLVSDSIKVLNISHTNVCTIKPSVMKCLPKLSHLILIGVPGCTETRRLAKEAGAGYKVFCGGEGFFDSDYQSISLCRGRKRPGANTPRPPYSTPDAAQASGTSTNAALPQDDAKTTTAPSHGSLSLPKATLVLLFVFVLLIPGLSF